MLTIVNDHPLLMIVNHDPLLTIVKIIVNKMFFFQKRSFFKNDCFFKTIKTVGNRFLKTIVSKTIVIRFLKVHNEWVVFKKRDFFPKTKRSFLKTFEKRNKKRLTTPHTNLKISFKWGYSVVIL